MGLDETVKRVTILKLIDFLKKSNSNVKANIRLKQTGNYREKHCPFNFSIVSSKDIYLVLIIFSLKSYILLR